MTKTKVPDQLTKDSLKKIPADIKVPQFDIKNLRSGIMHLGCGTFHRAHQAAITQEAVNIAGKDDLIWGIESVCMNRKTLYDILCKQDNLYSLLLKEPKKTRAEIIGIFTKVLHAPTDPIGIPKRIAQENIKIVTMTVTVGGYSVSPLTCHLDDSDSRIIFDLHHRDSPKTTIGIIAKACELIRDNGHKPPAFLSCDNLTRNGDTVKQALVDYISLYDDILAQWVVHNVQFPCTVVDRIAQPETEDDINQARFLLGHSDYATVPTEPIWDWSIENFEGPKPHWEDVGVRFVTDIEAYERGKLRLLNGTHMLIAYLGALYGYTTIDQSAHNPYIGALANQFMLTEQGATLKLSPDHLKHTVDKVMKRFTNDAIVQEIVRVGRNGSEKMIPRITDALRDNLIAHRKTPAAILVIAAWIYGFVLDARGDYPLKLADPLHEELTELARNCEGNTNKLAECFLRRDDIFGNIFSTKIHQDLAQALHDLSTRNIDEVIKKRLLPEFGGE